MNLIKLNWEIADTIHSQNHKKQAYKGKTQQNTGYFLVI
jgi:hypothetical protein